ncbi:MAG: sigma-70 family RNA polymerase sigma factor [Phycisphaerae bacterium]
MILSYTTHTTTALLDGLFDLGNDVAWRQFDERFRPIVIGFAGRLGLGPQDASDVAQETLTQFIRDYREGKYDRSRGRLRAWVIGIARHRVAEAHRTRAHRRELRGESAFGQLPGADDLEKLWDAECRQALLCSAMRELAESSKVSRRTLDAFRRHVLDQRPPEEVARELGTTVRAVYLAKHRCLSRLRTAMQRLGDLYDVA